MPEKLSSIAKPILALGRSAHAGMKRVRNGLEKSQNKRPAKRVGTSNAAASTKTNLIYSDLRDRILCGDLKPGTRLVIRRIAETHGASDIPVREALRLLEKDNLIRYLPYGSAFVRGATDAEIYEIFFVRGLLEGVATQLAASFMTDMTLRKLGQLCGELERCTRAQDVKEYAALNRQFHRTIFGTLPSTKLIGRIEDLWQFYGWSQLTFRFQSSRMAQSNAEHRKIVDALSERSMGEAARAAFEHKQNARRAFLAARKPSVGGESDTSASHIEAESIIEGIDLLCDIWGGAQWPVVKRGTALSKPDSIQTAPWNAKSATRLKK